MKIGLPVLIIATLLVLMGCGTSRDPVSSSSQSSSDISGHTLWGYYTMNIDIAASTVEIVPEREAMSHWNITGMVTPPKCTDCVKTQIVLNDIVNKEIDVLVTLKNPTAVTGYDIRGIMLPKYQGVLLANAGGYTSLWNNGSVYDRNGFMAFMSSVSKRAFAGYAQDQVTYKLKYENPQAVTKIGFAIDASWPANCLEAYNIILPQSTPNFLYDTEITITVNVKDWQDNVDSVWIYPYPLAKANVDEYIVMTPGANDAWSAKFTNSNHAAQGTYFLWIRAKSSDTNFLAWDLLAVTVPAPPIAINARYYVAKDYDNSLPYYQDGSGKHTLDKSTLDYMRAKANKFWIKYGFTLVDDGQMHMVNDSKYYLIDDSNEVMEMHQSNGQSQSPTCLSMYFVQQLQGGYDTAYAMWPSSVDSLSKHKSKDVFIVFSPNVWNWENVEAHESGHCFGALEDTYLLDPDKGYGCDELEKDIDPQFKYLFCDDQAYYSGNLMFFTIQGMPVEKYTLSPGQASFVTSFNKLYPNNW